MDYYGAMEWGTFIPDDSVLIDTDDIVPIPEALALCDSSISDTIAENRQQRIDYLNDINFLQFLQSK